MAEGKPIFLPADALKGQSLGISVSESPDLQRLGLFEDHFRLALGEIARAILFAGGEIFYGGHLKADGYTQFLIDELQRFGHRNKPFKICLAYTEHQRMSEQEIAEQREHIGLFGEIILLDPSGARMEYTPSKDAAGYAPTAELTSDSLTGMRKFLVENTSARVVLGGKRTGFQGRFPGIIEEILVSIEASKPLYLAGGFGGATLDAISVLTPDDAAWFHRYEAEASDYERLVLGLDAIKLSAFESHGWKANGLSQEENARLAFTYRPSEIAALIGHGLGSLGQE